MFFKSLCAFTALLSYSSPTFASACPENITKLERLIVSSVYNNEPPQFDFEVVPTNGDSKEYAGMATTCIEDDTMLISMDSQSEWVSAKANASKVVIESSFRSSAKILNTIHEGIESVNINGREVPTACRIYGPDDSTLLAYCGHNQGKGDFSLLDLNGIHFALFRISSSNQSQARLDLAPGRSAVCDFVPVIYSGVQMSRNLSCYAPPTKPKSIGWIAAPIGFAAFAVTALAYYLYKSKLNSEEFSPLIN